MKGRLLEAILGAVVVTSVVLYALLVVNTLMPRDPNAEPWWSNQQAVHCVQDQISYSWYCSKSPVETK